MKTKKRFFSAVLFTIVSLLLLGCAGLNLSTPLQTESQPEANEEPAGPTATPRYFLQKSAAALEPSSYIPIEQVGTYNKSIITDELLNAPSTLPDATASNLPYCTGMIIGNK